MSRPALIPGQILTGALFSEPMRVETVQANGPASWVVGLVGTQSERFRRVALSGEEIERLTILDPRHSFDGDGLLLRLGLQAYALGIAPPASRWLWLTPSLNGRAAALCGRSLPSGREAAVSRRGSIRVRSCGA